MIRCEVCWGNLLVHSTFHPQFSFKRFQSPVSFPAQINQSANLIGVSVILSETFKGGCSHLIVSRQLKWLFADWSGRWGYVLGISLVDGVNVPKLVWIFFLASADEGFLRFDNSAPWQAENPRFESHWGIIFQNLQSRHDWHCIVLDQHCVRKEDGHWCTE